MNASSQMTATLRRLCEERGMTLIERANGHYQIKGQYLVNFYPFAKKPCIYVAGTTAAIHDITPLLAIKIAAGQKNFKIGTRDKRPKNTRGRRRELWKRGVRACHWCKVPFVSFEETTLEHLIPLSKGGLDNPNNYALAHEKCNGERGDLLPHVLVATVE